MTNDTIVSIRGITKRFGTINALHDVSIDIQQGEIFALLGPSGCGKSTLLRLISGFESPTEGELLLDGKDMLPLPPNKRPINMVFQSYAVFPHMTVEENVAYGLKMEKLPAQEIQQRVSDALAQVHLADFAARKPDQLSGGQRQRVALARALIKKPRVLLLDEPLSALDAKLRDAMRLELVKLQESVGVTFIIVTHDQAEAMAMADRIAVLESGKLRQVASPAELYAKPVDAFVADFIGNINAFAIHALSPMDTGHTLQVESLGTIEWYGPLPAGVSIHTFPEATPEATHKAKPEALPAANPEAMLVVRPENVSISTTSPAPDKVSLEATLGDIAFQGQYSIAEIRLDNGQSISAIIDTEQALNLPDASEQLRIHAYWDINRMLLLPNNAEIA